MKYNEYKKLVTYYLENDNRELNYQNRVLIPLFEELFVNFDIVDTSTLYKNWENRGVARNAFGDIHTPDILVAKDWKLFGNSEDIDYKLLVEVKTPTAGKRNHAISEVEKYLDKLSFVVLTDCITWEFFLNENGIKYYEMYSLEKEQPEISYQRKVYSFPSRVCERNLELNSITWDEAQWNNIKEVLKSQTIKKMNKYNPEDIIYKK